MASRAALDCRCAFELAPIGLVLPRERLVTDINQQALPIDGLTSKRIGRQPGISPRTVDLYRARLMRKVGACGTAELVTRLLCA